MKGPKLIIYILVSLALTAITIMVALNLYPSWSQYARTEEEQLLLITLGSIYGAFLIRGGKHGFRELVMFSWPRKANIGQINAWAAFMFLGVICTPVTLNETITNGWGVATEILHYLFTVAGILFAYSEIVNYYRESKTKTILGWIGLGTAVIGMIVGYWTSWWTLGVGEMIAAFPVAIHILASNNFVANEW